MNVIERTQVYSQLQELSNSYLTELGEVYLELFVRKAKDVADEVVDDFVSQVVKKYTNESLSSIRDTDMLLAFTDLQSGFRAQMQSWLSENPVEVTYQKVSVDDALLQIPPMERESIRRSLSTLGVGTLGVVGLRFATGSNWLWLLELAVLAATKKSYEKGKNRDEIKLQQRKSEWLECEKSNIVSSVYQNLCNWFDNVEKKCEEIIGTYKTVYPDETR